MNWKVIILAGGLGTRLSPLTGVTNKHLLPVYDKPMVYYPLSTMMLAGLRDFVIISTPQALPHFETLLGDGAPWGVRFVYRAQERPGGIAECFRVADDLLTGHNVALILGDNLFHGAGLQLRLTSAMDQHAGATIFSYEVTDPSQFGVVVLDEDGRPLALEEKPHHPRSNMAVPGLYFYDADVVGIARTLTRSARGELEITDVNRAYLDQQRLRVLPLGRGTAWLDGGTHATLFEAAQYVKVVEDRSGLKIGSPEEVALRKGFITSAELAAVLKDKPNSQYYDYLRQLTQAVTSPAAPAEAPGT